MPSLHRNVRSSLLKCIWIVALVCGDALSLNAQKFKWDPVTPDDWQITVDSAKGYMDAVVVFDKESFMLVGPYYRPELTVYKRIRVLSSQGRGQGDIEIPFEDDKESIWLVEARAVLRNGKQEELSLDQVKETDMARGDDFHYKKRSFSIPGMDDDCIIEYRFMRRGRLRPWIIQQDIPVVHAEYNWRAETLTDKGLLGYSYMYTPNFQWYNDGMRGKTEYLPNVAKMETVRFSMDNIPAMKREPLMGNERTLRAMVVPYYGTPNPPEQFWNDEAHQYAKAAKEFCLSDRSLNDSLLMWSKFSKDSEKIAFVFKWVRSTISNIEDPKEKAKFEEIKKNASIRDVLTRGYASDEEICMLFQETLRKLGVTSYLAYGVENTSYPFVKTAKYKQLDVPLVAIPDSVRRFRIYAPGSKTTNIGKPPASTEGTTCMVVVQDTAQFFDIPFSSFDSNRTNRVYNLSLVDDGTCRGTFTEERVGLNASSIRAALIEAGKGERSNVYQKWMQKSVIGLEVDSLVMTGVEDIDAPMKLSGMVRFPCDVQTAGSRLIVQPFSGQTASDDIFSASVRQNPVVFGHASEVTEQYRIILPAGYVVESAPVDTTTGNLVGLCRYQCTSHDSILSVRKITQLYFPRIDIPRYDDVRSFFKTMGEIDRMAIVLNQRSAIKPPLQTITSSPESVTPTPPVKSSPRKPAKRKP